jgi:hypothetical protein
MLSNLPASVQPKITDQYSYSTNDYDVTVAFFNNAGFTKDTSILIATILLHQAKAEGVGIFSILNTFSKYTDIQLNAFVGTILNNNRDPISSLGFRVSNFVSNVNRNILP